MLVVGDLLAVAYYRRHAVWRHLVKLIPFAALGIVIGSRLLNKVNSNQLSVFIGALVLVMLALNAWRNSRGDGVSIPSGWWFPVSIGLVFTTWQLNTSGLVSGVLALVSGTVFYLTLRLRHRLTWRSLAGAGSAYLAYLGYVLVFLIR